MEVAVCAAAQKKKNGLMVLLGSCLNEKLLDYLEHEGNSSETTNVDDIMHTALVDAAVAEAPLKGSPWNCGGNPCSAP